MHANTSALNLLSGIFVFTPWNFDFCMHGGNRAKSTKLLVSTRQFEPLGIMCDKSHNHEPWTIVSGFDKWIFSTAAEAQYPSMFCDRYAECASTWSLLMHWSITQNFFDCNL